MCEKIREKLKEKMHIIVMTIIVIYLVALAIKTGHLVYTEYYKDKETVETSQKVDINQNSATPNSATQIDRKKVTK